MSDTPNSAHPESEERLRALIDAFGVAAERYGYSRKAYPRSAAAIHRENQRAESRRVLLDEVQRLRASLVEATRELDTARIEIASLTVNRDAWKDAAVGLGVNGKATRDPKRNLLTLSMRVDEGVLRLGGPDVLTATFIDMREQYEHAIAASLHTDTPNG